MCQSLLENGIVKLKGGIIAGQIHRINIALRQVKSGRTKTKLACMKGNFDEPCRGQLILVVLASAHLLSLEVLVEEIERSLVGLDVSHDGEHALSGIVMGCLGNRDTSS